MQFQGLNFSSINSSPCQKMISLLLFFLFGQVFSRSSSQSGANLPTSQLSPSEAACGFLEPLGNLTLDKNATMPDRSQASYNLPLKNSQGKLNLTVENYTQFSYNLDGKQYNYKWMKMNEDEKFNLCSCLTKLSENNPSESFINRQMESVCSNIMCSHLIQDYEVVMKKKESLDEENLGLISQQENQAYQASGLEKLGNKDFLALESGKWIKLDQETFKSMKQTPNFNKQTMLNFQKDGRIRLKESGKITYKKFLAKFLAEELNKMKAAKEFVCSIPSNLSKIF